MMRGCVSTLSVVGAAALVFAGAATVSAQSGPPNPGVATTVPNLTAAGTITQLATPAGAPHVGDALGLATQLQIATTPIPATSSGFMIKLDPSTGLQVRTATTFGPSFAERALTSGEGTVTVGVSFMSSTIERLGSQSFDGFQLRSVTAPAAADSRSGVANITESVNTTVIAARMGVTDKLDVGVAVPLVSLKIGGSTSLVDGKGGVVAYATGSDTASGLGDVAGIVKYRFYSFGDTQPDPGGLAVMGTLRFPTGDSANLRGLGVTRTLVSLIASGGQKRFRPHGNIGYEWWSKGLSIPSDSQSSTVTARNQIEYAAGFEFEAAPKATVLLDVVGGEVFGGGRLAFQPDPSPAAGTTSSSLVALPEGVSRVSLAPGLKVNLKGKLLLSLNALIALKDDGLHARVTPMAGIDLTF